MPTYKVLDRNENQHELEAEWFQATETPGTAVFYVGGHEVAAFQGYVSVTSDETPEDESDSADDDQPFNVINVSVSGSNPSQTAKELLFHLRQSGERKYGSI